MGSFEWRRGVAGSFAISAEGLRVFGRGPLMQLFIALLTVAASVRASFGRRGE